MNDNIKITAIIILWIIVVQLVASNSNAEEQIEQAKQDTGWKE